MPLQASATSRAMAGRSMTLPSSSTGTPSKRQHVGRHLRRQQLQREGDLVEDDRGDGNHQEQKCPGEQQRAKQIPSEKKDDQAPASTSSSEERARKSSAPIWPTIRTHMPAASTIGLTRMDAGRAGQGGHAPARARRQRREGQRSRERNWDRATTGRPDERGWTSRARLREPARTPTCQRGMAVSDERRPMRSMTHLQGLGLQPSWHHGNESFACRGRLRE